VRNCLTASWLGSLTGAFRSYLQMATLSLYLFNLLPLPFLDGTQLLETFLLIDSSVTDIADAVDLEALEGGFSRRGRRNASRRYVRWRNLANKTVRLGTTGLFAVCVSLALIKAIIQR
jgi:S2P endopeptidase